MSAIAPIVINDGQDTPVAHTFNPVKNGDLSVFRENSNGLPFVGEPQISLAVTDSGDMNTVKIRLEYPYLEEVSGSTAGGYVAAPKMAFYTAGYLEFKLPKRSDSDKRKDTRVLLANLLTNALIIDAVDNLTRPY